MSEPFTDGGPAFPFRHKHLDPPGWRVTFAEGMSLRDYFASAALTGLLADPNVSGDASHAGQLALACYIIADAMLRAREEQR